MNAQVEGESENMVEQKNEGYDERENAYALTVASQRLSIVRYVFLVQIEDGIATAAQRASLEYADAVLIGWPDNDSSDIREVDDATLKTVQAHMDVMESHIRAFTRMEREEDIDGMTDTLIRITERVAEIRRLYQPEFPLPTFAEIRRVVQEEWDEDMGKIDPQDPDFSDVDADGEAARAREEGRFDHNSYNPSGEELA